MALKKQVKSLDDVDEKFRDLYKETEDGFELQLEDDGAGGSGGGGSDDLRSKVNEFREKNIELIKRNQKLEKEMKSKLNISPEDWEEAQKALEKVRAIEEEKLIDAGKLDEVVEKRVKAMRDDMSKQLKLKDEQFSSVGKERDTLKSELGRLKIDTQVQSFINKVGQVRAGAMPDVMNRARSIFRLDESGSVVAMDSDGSAAFDSDSNPLTIERWSKDLLKEAPFLFEQGQGGGSQGGRKGDGGSARTILRDDQKAFGENLAEIATGKVKVVDSAV